MVSEAFLMINFKSAQSFKCAHRGRMCVCVFTGVSARTCIII
jgi:hypothetical protein